MASVSRGLLCQAAESLHCAIDLLQSQVRKREALSNVQSLGRELAFNHVGSLSDIAFEVGHVHYRC